MIDVLSGHNVNVGCSITHWYINMVIHLYMYFFSTGGYRLHMNGLFKDNNSDFSTKLIDL